MQIPLKISEIESTNVVTNEGEMLSLLCKNIDSLLNYYKVSIYFKQYTPYPQ